MISSYHVSRSQHEIVDVMLKSATAPQSILWQTRDGHRTVYPVTSLALDSRRQLITFEFSPASAQLSLDAVVYVKLPFRESVFKCQLTQTFAGRASARLPTEVHWRDLRESKRLQFRRGDRHVITRPYLAHLRQDQLPSLKLALRDISERGVGVYISLQNVEFFKVGKFIELTSVAQGQLARPLLGHVMWMKRTETKSERDEGLEWLVGVKMLDRIPAPELGALLPN